MTDIQEGIDLFNNKDFFAAHDYFEEKWIDAEKNERLFFQGMVQISVGCYHLICKNYKGSLSQYTKGTDKLLNYVPEYYGVDLKKLLEQVGIIIVDLKRYYSDNEEPDTENIPVIEYNK